MIEPGGFSADASKALAAQVQCLGGVEVDEASMANIEKAGLRIGLVWSGRICSGTLGNWLMRKSYQTVRGASR